MRLKYKKFIIIFTVAVMLIGMGTFSMIAPSMDFSFGSEKKDENLAEGATSGAIKSMSDSTIEDKITSLIDSYFSAKQQVDMTAMGDCVNDISHVDEKRLITEAQYVEAYKDIECTIKKAFNPGTYRVYVYYNVKVYDIDTLIPSLTALYVTSDNDGNFKVYLGTLDSDTQNKLEELDNSDEVTGMVEAVNLQLEDIMTANSQVREFYEMLESDEDAEAVEDNENIDQEGTTATAAPSVK